MDETPVKEFIKTRQKEGLVQKGLISIQNVKNNFMSQKSAYSVFRCKIKEFQGDEYTDFDKWDSFKF